MTHPKLPQEIDVGNMPFAIHHHAYLPRPVSVADDEQARATFGFKHKRTT